MNLKLFASSNHLTLESKKVFGTKFILPCVLFCASTILCPNRSVSAQSESNNSWGSIAGQIVVVGDVPTNPVEDVGNSPDKAICLVDGNVPTDDNIIVGENGELKDAIVMMYLDRNEEEPVYHPSYAEKKSAQTMEIDNLKCRFHPHALFVRPGQTLILKNSDAVGHNCHIRTLGNEHNINLPPNGSAELKLTESDKAPGEVVCDVHKWMDGVILVRENPYIAITDAEGKFTIENVPAGNWKFQVWHKKVGWMNGLDVTDKKVGRRGEFEIEIADDKTADLGVMKLPAEAFKE